MRTNIEINDKLMQEAMAASGASTKKATVEEGLRLLVQLKKQERIRELFGTVVWRGPDDDWFASDEEILKKRYGTEENSQLLKASDRELLEAKPVPEQQPR